jgi:hypothetical protein
VTKTGGDRLLIALGMAAVALVVAVVAWRVLRPRREVWLEAAIVRERDEAVREIDEEEDGIKP